MSTHTEQQDQREEPAGVFVRADGQAYAVPAAVLDGHRVEPERWAQVEADVRAHGGQAPATEATLYELPIEALAPYRLSDGERAALDDAIHDDAAHDDTSGFFKYAPNQPKGEAISGYTGYAYSVTFGSFQRGASGHQVYVGAFPMFQMPSQGTPTDTIR
jgi:hypothetical protein